MLKNFLYAIDIFGVPVTMNFFGREKSKSKAGGFFSLLLFVFGFWTIYDATQDMFSRANPKTSSSEFYIDDPPELNLYPTIFPIGFQVVDPDDVAFIDDTVYKLTMFHSYIETVIENDTIALKEVRNEIQTERCRHEHFGDLAPRSVISVINPTHCMVLNQTDLNKFTKVQGVYGSPVFQTLHVLITECENETSTIPCAPREKIHSIMSGAWFGFIYPGMVVDLQNFTNPDSKFPDASFFVINPAVNKGVNIELGYVSVVTDSGWITKSIQDQRFVKVNQIQETSQPKADSEKVLIDCYINANKLAHKYSRTYKKIQDALADIGGLANTAFLVLVFITSPYFRYKYKEALMNELFDVIGPEKENRRFGSDKKPKKVKAKRLKSELSELKLDEDTETTTIKKTNLKFQPSYEGTNQVNRANSIKKSKKEMKYYSIEELSPPKKDQDSYDLENKSFQQNLNMSSTKKPRVSNSLHYISSGIKMRRKVSTMPLIMSNCEKSVEKSPNPLKKSDDEEPEFLKFPYPSIFLNEVHKIDSHENYEEKKIGSKFNQRDDSNISNIEILNQKNKIENSKQRSSKNITFRLNDKDTHNNSKDQEQKEGHEVEDNEKSPKRVGLSLCEYICSFICETSGLKKKIEVINEGINKIDQRIDIVTIVKKLQELDKLRILLFDYDTLLLFNNLPKPEVRTPKALPPKQRTLSLESLAKVYSVEEQTPKHRLQKAFKKLKEKRQKTELDKRILRLYEAQL